MYVEVLGIGNIYLYGKVLIIFTELRTGALRTACQSTNETLNGCSWVSQNKERLWMWSCNQKLL